MNIQEFCEQLNALSERAKDSMDKLERERNYVIETMQKTQGSFGDQPPGQKLVTTLYHANNALTSADSALYMLRSRIESYIQQTRK